MKIIGVYKITNTITNDFYIGSSKDVKKRWTSHKCKSTWKQHTNNQLYKDMQKYGVDKFEFQILAEVEEASLKKTEQQFIETLKPTYNDRNADGWNTKRHKEYQKEYHKTDKFKEYKKEYYNQLCFYNSETLTLNALSKRFWSQGIPHPTLEAKKYLIKKESKTPIEFYDVYP